MIRTLLDSLQCTCSLQQVLNLMTVATKEGNRSGLQNTARVVCITKWQLLASTVFGNAAWVREIQTYHCDNEIRGCAGMYLSWRKVRAECILTPVEEEGGGRCRCAFKDIAKTYLQEVEYIRM